MSAVPGFSLDLPSARGPVSIKIDDIDGVTIIHSARSARGGRYQLLEDPKPQTATNSASTATVAQANSNTNISLQDSKKSDSHATVTPKPILNVAPSVVDSTVTQLTAEQLAELTKFKQTHDPLKSKENKVLVEELQAIHALELELFKKHKINLQSKVIESDADASENVNIKKSAEYNLTADKVFSDGVPGYLSARKKAVMLHLKLCAMHPIRYKSVTATNERQPLNTSVSKFADGEAARLKILFDLKEKSKLSEEHISEIKNALKASLATALGILVLFQEHYEYRMASKSTGKTEKYIQSLLNGLPIEQDQKDDQFINIYRNMPKKSPSTNAPLIEQHQIQMGSQNPNKPKKTFASDFRAWEDCLEKIDSGESCVIA